MDAPSFAHLHVKSQYTLLGAVGDPKVYAKQAKKLGMTHLALTDEMNMFGAVAFYMACKKEGIHPVMGAELIVAPGSRLEKNKARDNHRLVALIRNEAGYVALNHLLTEAYLTGRHFVPRIDKDLLLEQKAGLTDGIIFLSGDLRGEVQRMLARGKPDEARAAAIWYRDLVGAENYCLELMDLGWGSLPGNLDGESDQREVNKQLIALGEELGIQCVVTNNVHYVTQDRAFHHEVIQCLGMTNTLEDEFRFRFPTDQFFLKSPRQMHALFGDHDAALTRTVELAERCSFEFEFGNYRFPIYPGLKGRTPMEVLRELNEEGLVERLKVVRNQQTGDRPWEEVEAEYRDRCEEELGIIEQMGFAAYFLIVYDFINWAKENDIPVGPGRGSGAGSLVLFSLRITDIDPLPYNLLFERFLNPERVSMPDIDVDFCQDRRGEVIQYVTDEYGGPTRVTQIITFGKMLAKGVLRDVGRVMALSFSEVDKIAKLIPDQLGITLSEALVQEPRMRALMKEDPRYQRLVDVALGLEGTARHSSVHAAGVVIADEDLRQYSPLSKGSNDTDPVVTQFDMKYAEEIGLIKFDFLGLKTVTQVKNALDMARAAGKTEWDFFAFASVPLDDPGVYRLLAKGDTLGVFQLESSGMRELLRQLKPTEFEDIIAVAALYRPGPMGMGMHTAFARRKHGNEAVTYPHPMLREILGTTFGVIVFQEQVMQIAQQMGGYTLGQADILRRAMGKKKLDLMAEHRVIFTKGALERGVTEAKADEVFDLMSEFAKYGFNKSHTAAYGLIAYQTAWIKHHLPSEFYASFLTIESSNSDKVLQGIADARKHDIEVLPPDVNESVHKFTVVDEKVRFGLSAIKGLGSGAIEAILETRKDQGGFEKIEDFLSNVSPRSVNKTALEALIKCGGFDSMGYTRRSLHDSLAKLVEYMKRQASDRNSGQVGLFAAMGGGGAGRLNIPNTSEWPERERLQREKEALGFYITGHPMSSYEAEVESFTNATTADLKDLRPESIVKLAGVVTSMKVVLTKKNQSRMAFVGFEDMLGSVEITVFPKTFADAEEFLSTDEPLLITAKVDDRSEEGVSLLADKVESLAEVREAQTTEVRYSLGVDEASGEKLEELRALIEKFRGPAAVKLELLTEDGCEVIVGLPQGWRVQASRDMVEAVEETFGRRVTSFR
jgi:DNA polymerase III subunit alpha